MAAEDDEPRVPAGAILAAVTMVETLEADDDAAFARAATEIPHLMRTWGIPVLTQALGLLIGTGMSTVNPRQASPTGCI
jgi:hypothetical protein